jgi:hypothetical protein
MAIVIQRREGPNQVIATRDAPWNRTEHETGQRRYEYILVSFRVKILPWQLGQDQLLPVSRPIWSGMLAHSESPGASSPQQTLFLRGGTAEIKMHLQFPKGSCRPATPKA